MSEATPSPIPPETDTRARILAEAVDMFTRHGYHRTSLRVLADRLGLTKAAILYHFPAKDRIIEALMEPFLDAVEGVFDRAARIPIPHSREVLLEGLLDTYLDHQALLLMVRTDATVITQGPTFQRFMRLPTRAVEIIVGPTAPLPDRVWAVQLMGTLGDSLVFFDNVSRAELRTAVLAGTRTLLSAGPPSGHGGGHGHGGGGGNSGGHGGPAGPVSAERPGRTGRTGRPRALSGERVEHVRARRETHTVDEIAAELGISRATVYRYLAESQN